MNHEDDMPTSAKHPGEMLLNQFEAALLVEALSKTAVSAPSAHVLASLYQKARSTSKALGNKVE